MPNPQPWISGLLNWVAPYGYKKRVEMPPAFNPLPSRAIRRLPELAANAVQSEVKSGAAQDSIGSATTARVITAVGLYA